MKWLMENLNNSFRKDSLESLVKVKRPWYMAMCVYFSFKIDKQLVENMEAHDLLKQIFY